MTTDAHAMELTIISGRSGSGKSAVLHVLEDAGYYAVDNLPGNLLPSLIEEMQQNNDAQTYKKVVVSFDARNTTINFQNLVDQLKQLPDSIKYSIIYLDADSKTLMKRFSETRRKHPLSDGKTTLKEAIEIETHILEPLSAAADLYINTSRMSVVELRKKIRQQICAEENAKMMSVTFMSFGFKRGVPIDADFVFDVRCLPNPYWQPELRELTGQHPDIVDFLGSQREVNDMFHDISTFVDRWLPHFADNQRSYVTVAIGCTGGMHRSVYLSERLKAWYSVKHNNVKINHRELKKLQ